MRIARHFVWMETSVRDLDPLSARYMNKWLQKKLREWFHPPMKANYGMDEQVIRFSQAKTVGQSLMKWTFIIYSRATVQRMCESIIYNHFHPLGQQEPRHVLDRSSTQTYSQLFVCLFACLTHYNKYSIIRQCFYLQLL